MKYRSLLVLAVVLLCMPSHAGEQRIDQGAPQAGNPLTITLAADKSIIHPRDEILFTESFKNSGKKAYTVYDDQCFYGSDLKVAAAADPKKPFPAQATPFGHTVKPGARPADLISVEPGETFKREFTAFVTSDYRIFFQADITAIRMNKYCGIPNLGKEYQEVPHRFLGCGQVYNLGKPGSYKISARYDNEHKWITGRNESSPLWMGHVTSPEIVLKLAP